MEDGMGGVFAWKFLPFVLCLGWEKQTTTTHPLTITASPIPHRLPWKTPPRPGPERDTSGASWRPGARRDLAMAVTGG